MSHIPATNRRRPLGDIGNIPHIEKDRVKGKVLETKSRSDSSPRVDLRFKCNPLHAAEYVRDIYEHFHQTEASGHPSGVSMSRLQTEINEKMRTILVDWLVDVHLKFKLLPETLFLTIEVIDRFLDKKVVSRQKLQLVGVVSMLLAAKYEEIFPPEVKDFVYIAANTYTREDILRMERLVFQTLDFNLTFPTLYPFLQRGLQVMDAELRTQQLASFLAELALLDFKMVAYVPSLLAASCIYVANRILTAKDCWSRVLEHYCQFKVTELERCSNDLISLVRSSTTQKTQAVRKKYSYAKFGEVAKMTVDLQL